MPRYKLSAEERAAEKARKEQLLALLSTLNVTKVEDFGGHYKDMVGAFLESGLEAELEDELGYSKYDYRLKETDNRRNGHSKKILTTTDGELEIKVPRDRVVV